MIFVDFHAEATSEKQALGFYLDGRVSAVLGTHTHVPTADERVLPKGTALQTDVGMTGPYESIIGMRVDKVLKRFLLQTPLVLRGGQAGRPPRRRRDRHRRDHRQGPRDRAGARPRYRSLGFVPLWLSP